jgi:cell division protein FtsL
MLESLSHLPTIVPLLTAIAGGVVTFLVTKMNTRRDMTINDRLQLSKDQYQLIAELRQLMQEQKEETDELRVEIKQLQLINIKLTIENEKLIGKMEFMNQENEKLLGRMEAMNRQLDTQQKKDSQDL